MRESRVISGWFALSESICQVRHGKLTPRALLGCPGGRGLRPLLPKGLLTASSVCCSDVLALPIFKQEEPQLSPENEARLPPLQYVLCAATSPAVKLHEETLTYLNQGSSWRAGAQGQGGWIWGMGRLPRGGGVDLNH